MLHPSRRFVLPLLLVGFGGVACGTASESPPAPVTAPSVVPTPSNTTDPSPAPPTAPPAPDRLETEPESSLTPLPSSLPRYHIELSAEAQQQLEGAPWNGDDVVGSFTDENERPYTVELNYRGAYALQNLIGSGSRKRNWKVKFPKDATLRGRREWNFNREKHLRHKLAYDLMRAAGVRVPSAEYVLLSVNDEDHGMYLRFEDPDDKAWVRERFGDDTGDLFKAAYDVPNEPKRFALLTVLGPDDEDYFLHYNKKLNNNDAAATDFAHLRQFIDDLNTTPDAEFERWLPAHFDVESFTSYLVVANFISHWDSYPQRPKNYWLYQGPFTGRWFFIPWDMDATFQTRPSALAPMGPEASIFHSFDRFEPDEPNSDEEGTERPLVRRMFAVPAFREAYVQRYRALHETILSEDFLRSRLDELSALCEAHVSADDFSEVAENNDDIRQYIERRVQSIREQLDTLP